MQSLRAAINEYIRKIPCEELGKGCLGTKQKPQRKKTSQLSLQVKEQSQTFCLSIPHMAMFFRFLHVAEKIIQEKKIWTELKIKNCQHGMYCRSYPCTIQHMLCMINKSMVPFCSFFSYSMENSSNGVSTSKDRFLETSDQATLLPTTQLLKPIVKTHQ